MSYGLSHAEEEALLEGARRAAEVLMARGVPRERALEIATQAALEAVRRKYPGGLGQVVVDPQPIDLFTEKSQAAANIGIIKTVREAISPWLWVTSVIGFGLGLLNTRRIARMYRGWLDKRRGKKP